MGTILAVDPGKHAFGWARVLPHGPLLACGLRQCGLGQARRDALLWLLDDARSTLCVVVEVPQIYERRKSPGDPNDLVDVALVAGMVLASHPAAHPVRPRTWKGTVPKAARLEDYLVHRRNLAAMGLGPGASLLAYMDGLAGVPAALRHNVADAVGLGRWAVRQGLPRAAPAC